MKKTLKISLYVLLSLLLLAIIAVPILINYKRNEWTRDTFYSFTEPTELTFANIRWTDNTVAEIDFEKTAFFVPVKIKGVEGNLFMQFDSGSTATLLYGKTLEALGNPLSILTSEDSALYVEDFEMNIASANLKAERISVLSDMGVTDIDTSFVNIGTIGYDAFSGRTLIMDFKQNELAITERDIDALHYEVDLVEDVSVDKFPFLVTAQLDGNDIRLGYDTGSSMFPIVTTPYKLSTINKGATDTLCCVSSWGVKHDIYRKKSDKKITIGSAIFEDKYIYAVPQMDNFILNYCPDWLFFGGTGNELFLDKIVVIDTENNLFGIAN